MQRDIEQWRDASENLRDRPLIIKMGIGYFSVRRGHRGDNIQHVVRELVTAPS